MENDIIQELKDAAQAFLDNVDKDTKISGVRARKAVLTFKKHCSAFRKLSLEKSKKD